MLALGKEMVWTTSRVGLTTTFFKAKRRAMGEPLQKTQTMKSMYVYFRIFNIDLALISARRSNTTLARW